MEKVRFSEEQMVAILHKAETTSVADVARKRKITEQMIYNWRQKWSRISEQRRKV